MKSRKVRNSQKVQAYPIEIMQLCDEYSCKINLRAKKYLGQNFLIDRSIADKMAHFALNADSNVGGGTILEIGPGLGMLTRSIDEICQPSSMILVERDEALLSILRERGELSKAEVHCVFADALHFELKKFLQDNGFPCETHLHIIANLPYNIGTELLFKWFDNLKQISSITIMLQKEVADRILARSGCKSYSWLSIVSHIMCEVSSVTNVDAEKFWPKPKVESKVVNLKSRRERLYREISISDLRKAYNIIFRCRRKMLKNNLNGFDIDESALRSADIFMSMRAAELSIEQFVLLSKLLLKV